MADLQSRRRALRLHIIVALAALLALIPLNFLITPRYPSWMCVLVAWMPLIAGHTAWAMGLFDRQSEDLPRKQRVSPRDQIALTPRAPRRSLAHS